MELFGTNQTFNDSVELQSLLAASNDVPVCLTRRFLETAFDGSSSTTFSCAVSELAVVVNPNDTVRVRDLLRGVVTHDVFRRVTTP